MGVGLAGVVLLGLGVACGSSTTTDDDTTGGNGSGALETVETQISVGPNLADCVGLGPRTCMVVDGSFFYDYIEGFNHIEGCAYQLDIARDQVYTAENAPADGSLYRYRLLDIVSELCESITIESVNLTIGAETVDCGSLGTKCLVVDGEPFDGVIRTKSSDPSFDVYAYQTGCELEIVSNRWKIDLPWDEDKDAYAYEYVRTLSMDCDDDTNGSSNGAGDDVIETVETRISVGPNLADCVGLVPRTCMVVDGSLFYDDIEDFYHIEGCTSELDIARDQVYTAENAPADASLYRYRLLEIASEQCEAITIESLELIIGPNTVDCGPPGTKCLRVQGRPFDGVIRGFDVDAYETSCELTVAANRWKIDLPWYEDLYYTDINVYAYEYVRTLDMDCSNDAGLFRGWLSAPGFWTFERQISVGPNLADCVGLGPRICMVVNGSFFYDHIWEFNHIEGCAYELDITGVQGPDVNYYELLDIVSEQCEATTIESVNLTIGPETVDCGSLGTKCPVVDGERFDGAIRGFDVSAYETGCETEIVANRWKIDVPWDEDAYAYEYVRTLSMDCDA